MSVTWARARVCAQVHDERMEHVDSVRQRLNHLV